jgi:hypothetical protein
LGHAAYSQTGPESTARFGTTSAELLDCFQSNPCTKGDRVRPVVSMGLLRMPIPTDHHPPFRRHFSTRHRAATSFVAFGRGIVIDGGQSSLGRLIALISSVDPDVSIVTSRRAPRWSPLQPKGKVRRAWESRRSGPGAARWDVMDATEIGSSGSTHISSAS